MVRVSLSDRFPGGLAGVGVALAAGVAGVLGSFAAAGFAPGFTVAPVDTALSKVMPGFAITFAITVLGDLGQQLNLAFATVLVAGAYALSTALAMVAGRRLDQPWIPTVASAGAVWALSVALTGRPTLAVGPAVAVGFVVAVGDLSVAASGPARSTDGNARRRVVSSLAAAVGAGAVGYSVGADRTERSSATDDRGNQNIYGDVDVPEFDVEDRLALARERSLDVAGTDSLLSDPFYQVDINSVDPQIDASEWTLSITGQVERETEFTYADVAAMEHEHRFVTLRCVGEPLNGRKTDTAVWSGVPVERILSEANPTPDCNCVMLRADDGYHVRFPLDAFREGMLALGMNGRPLPRGHGAPARALVPGHWGEVNTKWLTEIEFIQTDEVGYWEKKGWHGTGPVKTVAKLHARNGLDDGRIQLGGHAYAGLRGISDVEVSVDGGDTWERATLSEALPDPDVWRQWAYEYDPPADSHEVVVRATDGTGDLQPEDESSAYPSGATGWVSKTVSP